MMPLLILVGVAAGAFVSTNVDAFLVLLTNLARAPGSRRSAVGGFLVATLIVLLAATGLAGAAALIPPSRIGLLGVVPLGMGLKQGLDVLRRREPEAPSGRGAVLFGGALLLHLTLSADNIAVLSALLADTMPSLRPVVVVTTLGMAAAWAALALAALRLPVVGAALRRGSKGLLAVLLVGVGVYILVDTETDVPATSAARAEARPRPPPTACARS